MDVQKYHAGAALLRNFFVDYSGGGASTRPGTKFINQCKSAGARLIPFQPSSSLSYVLEFGQNYIRFYSNGAPILETAVTGGTAASGDTFTITNSYNVGDWVYATGWAGLTNVNGNYYIVTSGTSGSQVVVTDLNDNVVTFAGTYTSGGQLQRVYTIQSPYATSDLFPNQATGNPGIKFVQDVTSLIICHPSYSPQILTINSPANWSLVAINFGPTIKSPTGLSNSTTLSSGTFNYAYAVTAVDANGQESEMSTPTTPSSLEYIGTSAGSITISWTGVSGASSYNVYKASPVEGAAIVAGALFGFIGNVTGTSFQDSYPGIGADFSQTPPILQNPFYGASVQSLTLTANATYTTVPSVTIAAPSSGVTATAYASLTVTSSSITHGTGGYDFTTGGTEVNPFGSTITFSNGVVITITAYTSSTSTGEYTYTITGYLLSSAGSITIGNTPSNPIAPVSTNVPDWQGWITGFGLNGTWEIGALNLVQGGEGYVTTPSVTISGSATATATLSAASGGNPGVPAFFQERLMLAAQAQAVQTYNMSQPASFYNFNVSNPSEDDDAISGSIISEDLNDIRSLITVPTGIIALTGHTAWLINGGGGISTMNPITPSNQTANPQAFNGANDLRPVKINFDLIYGTNKGGYFRDLTYNIYANIYTGQDITTLSNHLFYGRYFTDAAWAEEPLKTYWAVRNDGVLLSLGFVKEQDLIGWAHHDTDGQFTSVCSVIETVGIGNVVDAVYVIVQRQVNANTVQYVERFADRYFTHGWIDSWSVDCALRTQPNAQPPNQLVITGNATVIGNSVTLTDALDAPFTSIMATNNWRVDTNDGGVYEVTGYTSTSQVTASVIRVPDTYNNYTFAPFPQAGGTWAIWEPVTTVTGLTQLVGQNVTGTADGAVVPPTTVSASGSVTLSSPASKITLGLAFLPQLVTLPLDLGEPTVQGKRKKIAGVTLRVADTLGLQIGTSFANAVTCKDLQLGNIGSMSNQKVVDLVNPSTTVNLEPGAGDSWTIMDQLWQEAGSYCIQQNLPYPATILGAMPFVVVGDSPK